MMKETSFLRKCFAGIVQTAHKTHTYRSTMQPSFGSYGAVIVHAGKHKGKLGFYDDDHTDKTAIVYLEDGSYVGILRKYLHACYKD